MKKPSPVDKFLSEKRLEKARKERARGPRYYSGKLPGAARQVALAVPESNVLKLLRGTDESKTSPEPHEVLNVEQTFSFIRSPEHALNVAQRLARLSNSKALRSVTFNQRALEQPDLAAEVFLGLTARELQRFLTTSGRQVMFRGQYPANPSLRRFVRAVGLVRTLEVKHEYLVAPEESELEVFRLKRGRKTEITSLGAMDQKTLYVKQFADFVNNCLRRNDYVLTDQGRDTLCRYTGEIIDNAQEHSGSSEWYLAGYLDNEIGSHICEIAIFNFGRTIADSFLTLEADSYARRQVDQYIRLHKTKGFFSEQYLEDDLYTLIALQGGVSSKNTADDSTRGHGTIDLIRFFETVGRECGGDDSPPEMAVLSGSTHIRFDGRYQLSEDPSGRLVIAFNSLNSLQEAPDKEYVRNLREIAFPGTLISIRFPLHPLRERGTIEP
jgi:hypothetical protein